MGNRPVILPPNQNKFEVVEYFSATDYSTYKIHRKQFCVQSKLRIRVFYLPTDAQESCFKILKFTLKQFRHVSV
jgi:K+/H+ antiporter YhaU regulatory subunit KhtT